MSGRRLNLSGTSDDTRRSLSLRRSLALRSVTLIRRSIHTYTKLVYLETMAGYHLREIKTRGIYGEPSKIREELEEYEEAMEQGNRIMALVELADLYGALEAVVIHMGFNMQDLRRMSSATKRAFQDGSRSPKPMTR